MIQMIQMNALKWISAENLIPKMLK